MKLLKKYKKLNERKIMIDLHSHILYAVDDGAKNIEESLTLCKEAWDLGYRHICCTSHYIKGKYENKHYEKNFIILKEKLKENNIPLQIYRGNEIYLDIDTLRLLENNDFNTLGYSKYILVEFPQGLILNVKINILKILISKGYKPILAHVERYPELTIEDIKMLKKLSVKIQSNISAVETLLSNKYSKALMDGTIDILSSDVHNMEYRNYDLKYKLNKIKEYVGEEKYRDLIYNNPKKILLDEDL